MQTGWQYVDRACTMLFQVNFGADRQSSNRTADQRGVENVSRMVHDPGTDATLSK